MYQSDKIIRKAFFIYYLLHYVLGCIEVVQYEVLNRSIMSLSYFVLLAKPKSVQRCRYGYSLANTFSGPVQRSLFQKL